MDRIQHHSLLALVLLGEKKYTLGELAEKLHVCVRQTQRVLQYVKNSGYRVNSKMNGGVKYFWVEDAHDLIPAILTKAQNQAIRKALAAPNENLKAAIYTLTKYANMQLSLYLNK